MSTRSLRSLLTGATAAAAILLGGSVAGATVPVSTPATIGVGTGTPVATTTTTVTTVATTTSTTVNQTKILPGPDGAAGAPGGAPGDSGGGQPSGGQQAGSSTTTTSTTAKPGETTTTSTAPPQSLTPGQVDQVLRNQQKSGANSTAALLDALTPLQNLGMTAQEAAALGMGRFPVQGLANWTDDFGDPRDGPPPHAHQGNDLFTQFNTPVRAPADGTVRFETGGLGGLAAYVTTADGTYYYMAHLNSYADLPNGATVKQGQIVGLAGDTGNAKGGPPHVHFEIHPGGGAAVDPKPIIDGWVADALAKAPDLIASFQAAAGATPDEGVVPQILLDTGLTRRFSLPPTPSPPPPAPDPLTPPLLAPLVNAPLGD